MSNIQKSVSSAFAATRDARIDYHIVEKGSASLITGIYDQVDPITQGFYRKPDITEAGETAKAALIYGRVMITPYTTDVGVESSSNDAASILKTYRFIMGEGQNSGVPVGPNGTPLENIYIRDANHVPQPIVDSAGKPSMSNVVLASALGGLITSAPKIWDAIKGTSDAKIPSVDPVTGKPILSATEQAANKTAALISLGKLSDVNDAGKGDNYVLVYDAKAGKWTAKPINTALGTAIGSSTVAGGAGGKGGDGGNGGKGGNGGDSGGGSPAETPVCLPATSFVEYPHTPAPAKTKFGMIRLPTLVNTPTNEYTQQINVLSTNGIELHFFNNGCGKRAIWKQAAGDVESCPPGGTASCFVDPNKETVEKPAVPGASVPYWEAATASIKICLTANICGAEYLIYSSTFSETALSKTSYTFTAPTIYWSDTKVAPLLAKYPGQVFNTANPNVKLYLSRVDVNGSEYDLYFEGYKRLIGDTFYSKVIPAITAIPGTNTPQPKPVVTKADDGKFPDNIPGGGGMGAPSCPEPEVLPGTLPTEGENGTPGTTGEDGTTGATGAVTVDPAPDLPTIEIMSPCARQYGIQTTPPAYDAVLLPDLLLDSGITDPQIEVLYEIVVGSGSFSLADPIPSGILTNFNGLLFSMIGPYEDVMVASEQILLIPDENSQGDIHYTIVVTNSEGSNAGDACLLVPNQIVITDNQSATAKVCVDSSSSGGTGKVMVTFNNKTRDLTSGYVPFNTNPNTTAADMASNINGNVAFANAYPPTANEWLPLFVASASGDTVTISAPASRGDEFNGITLSTTTTAGFVFGDCIGTFLGGVTKTISDFFKVSPKWSALGDILYGIAGNVLGAVALNMIMGDAGQEQLSLPAENIDPVDVVFLYDGRIIKVPQEYNAAARTGHPTSYATWSSNWKTQWTQNPAWIVYDFLINKKYGLGQEIVLTSTQQQKLLEDIFKIGYYCDEIVTTNGVSGPRYGTNVVITDGTKIQILQQLCSVFLGSVVFHNGGVRIVYDHFETTPILLVNQSNASNFDKSLTSSKNFINKVRLSYIEPANFYTEEIVIAEDTIAVQTYGERATNIVSFGCTDVNQALRYATWILNTEIENSVIISYTGGLDHYNLIPGDLVEFYDSNERNIRRAGRIVSQTGTFVILDAPIASAVGDYFSLTLNNGAIHQTTIAAISGVNVTMTAAPASASSANATFIAATLAQGRKYYKVIKIDEISNSKFNITLQLYSTDKY